MPVPIEHFREINLTRRAIGVSKVFAAKVLSASASSPAFLDKASFVFGWGDLGLRVIPQVVNTTRRMRQMAEPLLEEGREEYKTGLAVNPPQYP